MKLVYNPPLEEKGSPIKGFIYKGTKLPDFPGADSGIQLPPGKVAQFHDDIADALLANFGFLKSVTPASAKEIAERKERKYKCEYCDDSFDKKIALVGHSRKHAKEIAAKSEPKVDESIAPIVGVEVKDGSSQSVSKRREEDLPDGVDGDGVEWYGGGVKESGGSGMRKMRESGDKGHFGGGELG